MRLLFHMKTNKHLPLRARLCRLVSNFLALNRENPDIDSAI